MLVCAPFGERLARVNSYVCTIYPQPEKVKATIGDKAKAN